MDIKTEQTVIDNPTDKSIDSFLDDIFAGDKPTEKKVEAKTEEVKKETVGPKFEKVEDTKKEEEVKKEEVNEEDDIEIDEEDLDIHSKKLLKKKKVETTKKVEDKVEDLEKLDVPADASAKTKKAFAIARGEAVKLRKELEELRTKGVVPETVTAELENARQELENARQELARLKEREEQVQDLLYRTQLEETEVYRNTIVQPKKVIEGKVRDLAAKSKVDPKDLWNVVTGRSSQEDMELILSNLNDLDRGRIGTLQDKFEELKTADEALRANQKESVERFTNAQKAAKEAADKAIVETSRKVYNECFNIVKNAISSNPIFQADEDDAPEIKEAVANLHSIAESLDPKPVIIEANGQQLTVTKLTPKQLADAAYAVPVGEYLYAQVKQLQETIKKQAQKLAKYKSSNPGFKSGSSVNPSSKKQAGDESIEDFLSRTLGK